jgi:L-lactate permease
MLGANLASVGISALFAAEPTPAFDVKALGPYLPYAIGGVFTLGVIVVGLVMSRKKSAQTFEDVDGIDPEQAAAVYVAPNPLWKCVVPGVFILVVGAGIVFAVIPLYQQFFAARQAYQATLKNQQEEAMKTVLSNLNNTNFQLQQVPPVQFQQPVPFTPPKINMPVIQPQIKIPQIYVDSKGMIHSR